jgi:hypothetical protein
MIEGFITDGSDMASKINGWWNNDEFVIVTASNKN